MTRQSSRPSPGRGDRRRHGISLAGALIVLLGLGLGVLPGGSRPVETTYAVAADWAGASSIEAAPEAQGARLQGYGMGFFRAGQSPITSPPVCPSIAQIDEDLVHIDQGHLANAIRAYGQSCNLDQVPARVAAVAPSLSVYSGVSCPGPVDQDIATLARNANTYPNVKAAVICNEASIANPKIPATTLAKYIQSARGQLTRPVTVTTADLWSAWLDSSYQKVLSPLLDTLVVHVHPYWDNQCVTFGAQYVQERLQAVRDVYPGKTLVLGETGWPTAGGAQPDAARNCTGLGQPTTFAVPSVANQQRFLQDFLARPELANLSFFYFESYDEPWKLGEPNGVGPNWGTHTVGGTCKGAISSVFPPANPASACAPRVAALPDASLTLAGSDPAPPARPLSLLQARAAAESDPPSSADAPPAAAASADPDEVPVTAPEEAANPEAGSAGTTPPPSPAAPAAPAVGAAPGSTASGNPASQDPPPVNPTPAPTARPTVAPSDAATGAPAAPFPPGPVAAPPPLLPPFPPFPPLPPPPGPVVIVTGATNPTAVVGGGPATNNVAQILSTLVPNGSGPCAVLVGATCVLVGDLVGSSGVVTGSMRWQVVVPAGRIPNGAIGTVFLPTTVGIEFFDCPASSGGATTCGGATRGNALQGGTVRVFAGNAQVAQGTVSGPGPTTATPTTTVTVTPTGTTTSTVTPTSTPSPSPTLVPRLFSANTGSSNVSIFDPVTNQAVFTIPLPSGASLPIGLAFDGNGTRLYTVNQTNLSVLDAVANLPLGNIALPAGAVDPVDLAFNPRNGRLYVPNGRSANVSVINGVTNQPLFNIALPPGADGPTSLVLDPAGTRAYVANGRSANVSVIDTTNDTALTNISLPAGALLPVDIAINPTGTRLYTVDPINDTVSVIDATINQPIGSIRLPSGGSGPVAVLVSRDGTRIFTANQSSDNVSVLDARTNQPLVNIPLPAGATQPFALALGPDATRLYTVNDSNLSDLDIVGNRPIANLVLPTGTSDPAALALR